VCELWSRPGSTPHRGCEELWSSETHFGDGYLMLLALPSTPESIAQPQMPPPLAPWKTTSINEQRAKRGFGPLRGWEGTVAAGYAAEPAHQDLPADDMVLIDRGGERAEKLIHEYRSRQRFCAGVLGWPSRNPDCHRWHHFSVPCDQAHRFPLHRNAMRYLPMMGGEAYVEGCAAPVEGHIPAAEFIKLIEKRDQFKRPWLHPDELDSTAAPENCLASSPPPNLQPSWIRPAHVGPKLRARSLSTG